MKEKTIAIGSDHAGYELKGDLFDYLKKEGFNVSDFGTFSTDRVDYPLIAKEVARAVSNGCYDCGIIICGSGIGVSIAANKVKGIRAAVVSETYSAKMSRAHNDANVLCMGQKVVSKALAQDIVEIWLNTPFEGGRHQKRIDIIEE